MFFGDGYSYEAKEIQNWVSQIIGSEPITHKTLVPSPKTGGMVPPILIRNHNLRLAIQSWQAHKQGQAKAAQEAGPNEKYSRAV